MPPTPLIQQSRSEVGCPMDRLTCRSNPSRGRGGTFHGGFTPWDLLADSELCAQWETEDASEV